MKRNVFASAIITFATIIVLSPGKIIAASQPAPLPSGPGPFQLSATARCGGGSPEIDLAWTKSTGATRYDVYRNGSHLYNVLTSQTFKNQLLAPGTAYTYSVKASNVSGRAQTSNSASATAPTCVASTPPRSTVVASPAIVRPVTPMPSPSAPAQITAVPSTVRPATLPSTATPLQPASTPSVNRPITSIPSNPAPSASPSQGDFDRLRQAAQRQLIERQRQLAAQPVQAPQPVPPQQVSPPKTNAVANNANILRLQKDTTIAQLGNYGRTPGGIVDFRTGQIVAPSPTTSTTTPTPASTAPSVNRPITPVPSTPAPTAIPSQIDIDRQRQAVQQQLIERQRQRAAQPVQAPQPMPKQQPTPPAINAAAINADVQRLQRDTTIAQLENYGRTPGGIVDLRTGQIVAPSTAASVQKSSGSQNTNQIQSSKLAPVQIAKTQAAVQKTTGQSSLLEQQAAAERAAGRKLDFIPGTAIPKSTTASVNNASSVQTSGTGNRSISAQNPAQSTIASGNTFSTTVAGSTPMTINASTGEGTAPSGNLLNYGNWGGPGYPAIDCKNTDKIRSWTAINKMDEAFKNHDLAYCAAQDLPLASPARVETIFDADMKLINDLKAITKTDFAGKPFKTVEKDLLYREEALRYFENKTRSQQIAHTWKASTDYLAGLMGPDPDQNWFYQNTKWVDSPIAKIAAKPGELIVGGLEMIEKVPADSKGGLAVAGSLGTRAAQKLADLEAKAVDKIGASLQQLGQRGRAGIQRVEDSLQQLGQQGRQGLQKIENSLQSAGQQVRTWVGNAIQKFKK